MSAAPDFASAVAGYRAWQLGAGGVLFPLALPAAPPWEPAVNRARCFAGRDGHEAPATHCTCGLHALHDPDDGRLKLGHPAVGAIAAWGEIEVYAAGFRAEYASVIALAHEPSRSTGPPARLREAARRYGVRLVPLAELEAEASELALPLPDAVLPKRQAGTEVTSGECAGGWAGRGEIARWAHGWRACPREALTKRAGIDASVGGITCTRRIGGADMKLKVGNRVKVEAESTERSPRTGVIEEVVSEAPSPRYRIHWDDGHESIYAPAAGAVSPAEPTEKA